MIIPKDITGENIFTKIFDTINKIFSIIKKDKPKAKGRPRKYTDEQIVACMIYQVKYSIFSLRELEWRIKQDATFKAIIGLKDVPDYTTLSIRINSIEKHIFYGIFNIAVAFIDPSMRLCTIDSTALRSSIYDSEAQYGIGSRLGTYKGYKLHLVASADDIYIPIAFTVTTAEVYDNQVSNILYDIKIFNPFLVLADAAYDDTEWFKKAKALDINLLTDINMRRANSIESFKDQERYKNALFLKSPIGQRLYKNRISIEQLFSILKGLYNLENPRLYGKQRYTRHIQWVLFAYLLDEYTKKQEGIKSRKYPWNQ